MIQPVLGCVVAAAIAVTSLRLKFLNASGALAQFFLGWMLFGIGGLQWTIPILVFFLSASLLSKSLLRSHPGVSAMFEKNDIRDAWQVLANGGVNGVFLLAWLVSGAEVWYAASLGSLAAAAADTWGTEVGLRSSAQPRLLITLRTVEPGRSGGVTAAGFAAGLIGAVLVTASGACWITPANIGRLLIAGAAAGIAGTMVDSLLGSTVQIQYCCTLCGKITERRLHCGVTARRARGLAWMGNDMVNLVCTTTGGVLCWFLFQLL